MGTQRGVALKFNPVGVQDTLDTAVRPGAMASLQNLIPDPSTPNVFWCRPAAFSLTSFVGFTSPGVISAGIQLGTRVYGLVASGRNPGSDEPFVYDLAAGSFVAVSGISSSNVPTTQGNVGDWTPPTMAVVGSKILVTHPGFAGSGNTFGWFDISGFSLNTLTGTTVNGNATVTGLSGNPIASGVTIGMSISGTGIQAGSTVIGMTTTTITMSRTATANGTPTLTITGGSIASPLWVAGNTTTNGLPGVATGVSQFNNRAFFSYLNQVWYTDVLNPTNIANATNFLIAGDTKPVTALASLGLLTTIGGIVQALVVFKQTSIWQVTGDTSLSTLALNILSASVGTVAPRSVVNVPLGLCFMAVDGLRIVQLTGTISDVIDGLVLPFEYAVAPTRASAVYNVNTYRICVQNGAPNITGNPYQEYWYNFSRNAFSGPHTFRQDLALSYNNTCIAFNTSVPRTMFQSDILVSNTSNYIENNVVLSYVYETAPMSFGEDVAFYSLIESSIEVALGLGGNLFYSTVWGSFDWGAALWGGKSLPVNPQLSLVALDQDGSTAAQCSVSQAAPVTVWGAFNWGSALWGGSGGLTKLKQHGLGWNKPAVGSKLQIMVTGVSSATLKLGALRGIISVIDFPPYN